MTPQEFNKIKTSDILSRFERWKELIEKGGTVDEMKIAVRGLMKGCVFETFIVNSGKFFRARKNIENTLFNNVSELWYPPDKLIKEIGRANRVGESLMYLAQDGRTALFEMRLKEGNYVTVGQFGLRDNQKLNLIYLNTLESLNHSSFNQHFKDRENRLKKHKYNRQGIENVNLIHNLLGQEFMRTDIDIPEKAYTLSVAVAENLLSYPRADGMIYPSLRSVNDYNIVLKKKNTVRKIELKRCDKFRITTGGNEAIVLNHLLTTTSIDLTNGVINWTDKLTGDLDWHSSGTESLRKLN